ncbi:uncharacterized protein LOC135436926 [Drosophila montana]|uniref:uncharacterized protein LOC135436926 n=1 Tax=Drosophila montana TaxID=40370 RepID=UPI00313BF8C0
MWQQQMLALSVYWLLAQAEGGFNRGSANNEAQLRLNLNAWQPLTGHNNWLILQATTATDVQQQQQQQQQQGRLPVNYYAYNHRYQASDSAAANVAASGNYKQVRANLNESPSYVWAISPALRQLSPPSAQDVPEVRARPQPEVRQADSYATLANAPDEANEPILARPPSTTLHINNYLAAFERAVLKVRNFCDTVRELISVEEPEVDAAQEQEPQQQQTQLDAESSKLAEAAAITSKEVQGRHIRLAESYQGRKLKKLKKKIQKLLLPLLIAYKLKFLTLIPVLIGGLVLLVGTTGLAGFFFALFTAVMSLKTSTGGGGHSSKAIVLKKI